MQYTLRSVLERHGMNLAAFAKAARVNKSTVTRWVQNGIPARRLVDLERETGVPRFELRPDLYTLEPRQ